jgi:hypothetical protein
MLLAIAVASSVHAKELYVTQADGVLALDATTGADQGNLVAGGAGGLLAATGVAQGPDGAVYVSSAVTDEILKYDGGSGAFISVFADETDLLRSPAGLAFGPNGNLFVANRLRNEVAEFDLSGNVVNIYETAVGGAAVVTPEDVAFGPDGLLYVASANTNTVVRFVVGDAVGSVFVSDATGLDYPHGLAFRGNNLFVASHLGNEVLEVDANGDLISSFAAVDSPVGLSLDDQGDLNVVSFGSGALRRFEGSTGLELASLPIEPTAAFITLIDRPRIASIARSPTTIIGGCETSVFTISLDRPAPTGGVIVSLSSNNPAAILPASVVVPTGATVVSAVASGSPVTSTVTATITAAAFGSVRTSFLSVKPVGLIAGINALTLSPTTVPGGGNSTGTVTLACAANAGSVVVNLSSDNVTLAQVPATLTIPLGSQTGTFSVSTTAPAATSTVNVTASLDRAQARVLTVTQSVAVTSVTLATASISGGLSTSGTATLSVPAPTGGLTLTLSTSDPALVQVPATVLVQSGQTTSDAFAITTAASSTSVSVAVRASFNASTASRNLSVRPSAVSSVALSPTTVRSGQTSTGTITLNTPAATGGIVVSLSSTSPAVAAPTVTSITIPGGATTGTFSVLAGTVAARSTTRITAVVTGTTSRFATLTVNP